MKARTSGLTQWVAKKNMIEAPTTSPFDLTTSTPRKTWFWLFERHRLKQNKGEFFKKTSFKIQAKKNFQKCLKGNVTKLRKSAQEQSIADHLRENNSFTLLSSMCRFLLTKPLIVYLSKRTFGSHQLKCCRKSIYWQIRQTPANSMHQNYKQTAWVKRQHDGCKTNTLSN